MKNPLLLLSAGAAALVALVVLVGLVSFGEACRDFSKGELMVGPTKIDLAIAGTPAERTVGLAGCRKIPQNSGMYFPYDPPQSAQFWMKGMVIPLDIVWIAGGKVVGVVENIPPVEKTTVNPPIYTSPVVVDGVLEVAAGTAKAAGLTVGTPVNFVPK